MKDTELLRMFLRNGWKIQRITGSHHHLYKDGQRETIAVHRKEINPNLAKRIIEKRGLK